MSVIVTGVLSGNSFDGWFWEQDWIDLAFEEALKDMIRELEEEGLVPEEELEEKASQSLEDIDFEGRKLYGGWKKDEEGKYEPDTNADYSAIYNPDVHTIQVVHSKYAMECNYCSPCYPNQGDLDSRGRYYLAYSLPPDFYSDDWLDKNKDRIIEISKLEEVI